LVWWQFDIEPLSDNIATELIERFYAGLVLAFGPVFYSNHVTITKERSLCGRKIIEEGNR
jgi:hypothetical protein